MATMLSPLQQAFHSFLLTMPPDRLEELLKYLTAVRADENNQNPVNGAATRNPSLDVVYGSGLPAPSTPRSPALRGKRLREGKRRPLNSFIAFRSFYSNIFPDLTQKARSGILKFLWQNDPCKAKWAILAKAYSIIRDDHVGEVTLDSFLNLNTDFLGIVESNRYLETMGWELTVDGQSQYTMTRIKSATAAEADISTNYSVNDVVTRCYDMGYVSEDRRIHKPSHNNSGPVMAFAAQPTLIVNESNKIRISGVNTIVIDHSSAKSDDEVSAADSTADTPSPDPSEMSSVAPETFSHIPGVLPVQPFLDTQQKFNNELGANLQLPNVDETGYPFPFNPDMQTPVLNYDAMFAEQFVNYDFDRFLNF